MAPANGPQMLIVLTVLWLQGPRRSAPHIQKHRWSTAAHLSPLSSRVAFVQRLSTGHNPSTFASHANVATAQAAEHIGTTRPGSAQIASHTQAALRVTPPPLGPHRGLHLGRTQTSLQMSGPGGRDRGQGPKGATFRAPLPQRKGQVIHRRGLLSPSRTTL